MPTIEIEALFITSNIYVSQFTCFSCFCDKYKNPKFKNKKCKRKTTK